MKSYPIQIINSFTAGEISRRQFVQHFSNWQKSNGANFDCKGTANRDGDFITYRGITARLVNGVLYWKNNMASANIAQGVTKAIADGGVMGMITGALVGAAGAVQIASLVAAKPVPPSFSTGGIVGGSSMYGDNIATNLNSREMVMNMNQQKGLWDFINGGSKGGNSGANIVVNNNAANMVSAQPRITKDQIELLIDARVNDSLTNGRYNKSLNIANNSMGGEFYGI